MTARYIVGDTRDIVAGLDDDSVDLILTSPPFLALRSYLPADHPDKHREIGSEPTPEAFIDTLLDLTEEWARVLAPHGSLCIELGDTYAGGGQGPDPGKYAAKDDVVTVARSRGSGWPQDKSLALVPQSYAWALAYGRNPFNGRQTPPWRVRNIVRWCRPNPPVGALGDKFRPATSEMVVACKARDRWFDLDAVRTEGSPNTHARLAQGVESRPVTGKKAENPNNNYGSMMEIETAGAPPLDYWEIPTQPSNGEGNVRRYRVRVDAGGDGIRRTTSPDCPVHGSGDRPDSNAPDGGREADSPSRNERSDDRPEVEPLPGFAPIPPSGDASALSADSMVAGSRAATGRSKSSRKMDPAPGTIPEGTPSAGTGDGTGRTSTSPALSERHPGTRESNSDEAYPSADEPGTSPRNAHNPSSSSACTCSYVIEFEIPETENDRHYASKPRESKPRNRQAEPAMSRGGNWNTFPNVEVRGNAPPLDWWEIPTQSYSGAHYATWPERLCVRPILSMCPEHVCRTCGQPRRRIIERQRESTGNNAGGKGRNGREVADLDYAGTTLGWTDCGHNNNYRRGIVLDPFAGSGTTLAVAEGHARDSIGIDLDPRNADLAYNRIGGLFLTIEHHPTTRIEDTQPL